MVFSTSRPEVSLGLSSKFFAYGRGRIITKSMVPYSCCSYSTTYLSNLSFLTIPRCAEEYLVPCAQWVCPTGAGGHEQTPLRTCSPYSYDLSCMEVRGMNLCRRRSAVRNLSREHPRGLFHVYTYIHTLFLSLSLFAPSLSIQIYQHIDVLSSGADLLDAALRQHCKHWSTPRLSNSWIQCVV